MNSCRVKRLLRVQKPIREISMTMYCRASSLLPGTTGSGALRQARQPFICCFTRPSIRGQHIIECGDILGSNRLHDLFDHAGNRGKRHVALEEGLYRHFIRGIEYCGRAPPDFQSLVCKPEAREALEVGLLEIKPAYFKHVQGSYPGFDPLRKSQGVSDGRAHVRISELGQYRAIHIFNHGMNNALGMNDDLDLL